MVRIWAFFLVERSCWYWIGSDLYGAMWNVVLVGNGQFHLPTQWLRVTWEMLYSMDLFWSCMGIYPICEWIQLNDVNWTLWDHPWFKWQTLVNKGCNVHEICMVHLFHATLADLIFFANGSYHHFLISSIAGKRAVLRDSSNEALSRKKWWGFWPAAWWRWGSVLQAFHHKGLDRTMNNIDVTTTNMKHI